MSMTEQQLRERLSVSVEEAAGCLGVGRTSAYAAVRSGQIPSIRVGRKVRVPARWLVDRLGLAEATAERGA